MHATEVGTTKIFRSLDFRLVKDCEFTNESTLLRYKYSFEVEGNENYPGSKFLIQVQYASGTGFFGGFDVSQMMVDLKTECKNRNELVKKTQEVYVSAAKSYFQDKDALEIKVNEINAEVGNALNKAGAELKRATKDIESAQENAHTAAVKGKEAATAEFDKAKTAFDSARDHFVGIVHALKEKVDSAHEAKSLEEFDAGVQDIQCNSCN